MVDRTENQQSCACRSPDARECYALRYPMDVDDENDDSAECECGCHDAPYNPAEFL